MSFPAYEEFCSNYELLTEDVAILRRSVPNWAVFEQGIEALSKSVLSTESRKQDNNRSMLMNDLMIKVFYGLAMKKNNSEIDDFASRFNVFASTLFSFKTSCEAPLLATVQHPIMRYDKFWKTYV